MSEWVREKKCAVIGLARAGVPAARFLAERGNRVIGYDDKTLSQISDEARDLADVGVELRLGNHEFAGLSSCHMIVLSPGLKIHHQPLQSTLEAAARRGAEIIGELELAARHCPAPMIAVTGTKGKSTTVKLISEMLQACGIDAVRAGNTGTPLIAELPRLSPQSWAVVEVSSFQLERAPTFKPRIAVLLSLLADHQDYHPSLDQYWQTKLQLFAHQKSDDSAIFNRDDARVRQVLDGELLSLSGAAPRWMTSGQEDLTGIADNRMNELAGVQNGALGWWQNDQFQAMIALDEIPLRGAHNIANLAAALGALRAALGETALDFREQIAAAIRAFETLPHRLEIVAQKNGVTWVNDSQSTIPEASIRAVQAFAAPVTLIAGGRDKLGDVHGYDALGAAIAAGVRTLITIGEAGPIIAAAARAAGLDSQHIIEAENLTAAVQNAKISTPSGGTVVFSPACASFDQFTSYEDRGERFRSEVLTA